MFQCLATLTVRDFFLISNLNLPSLSLTPFPLVLSPQPLLKSLSPSFLYIEEPVSGHLTAFSSPGWTAPALSAYPHRRGVPSLGSFLWPFSGCAPTDLCFYDLLLFLCICLSVAFTAIQTLELQINRHTEVLRSHNSNKSLIMLQPSILWPLNISVFFISLSPETFLNVLFVLQLRNS